MRGLWGFGAGWAEYPGLNTVKLQKLTIRSTKSLGHDRGSGMVSIYIYIYIYIFLSIGSQSACNRITLLCPGLTIAQFQFGAGLFSSSGLGSSGRGVGCWGCSALVCRGLGCRASASVFRSLGFRVSVRHFGLGCSGFWGFLGC